MLILLIILINSMIYKSRVAKCTYSIPSVDFYKFQNFATGRIVRLYLTCPSRLKSPGIKGD